MVAHVTSFILRKNPQRSRKMLAKLVRALKMRDLNLIEEIKSQLTPEELRVMNSAMQRATFSVGMDKNGQTNALLAAYGDAMRQCF